MEVKEEDRSQCADRKAQVQELPKINRSAQTLITYIRTHGIFAAEEASRSDQSPNYRGREEDLRFAPGPLRRRVHERAVEIGSLGIEHLNKRQVIDNAAQHCAQQLARKCVLRVNVQVVTELLIGQ